MKTNLIQIYSHHNSKKLITKTEKRNEKLSLIAIQIPITRVCFLIKQAQIVHSLFLQLHCSLKKFNKKKTP